MDSGNNDARGALVRHVLSAVVMAMASLWTPAAMGQGCVWTMPDPFMIYQENGYAVRFDLRQQGTDMIGKASYTEGEGGWAKLIEGGVTGSIADQRLYLRVQWVIPGRNSIGVYVARLENGYPRGAQSGQQWLDDDDTAVLHRLSAPHPRLASRQGPTSAADLH
jgi:hypothetical protein